MNYLNFFGFISDLESHNPSTSHTEINKIENKINVEKFGVIKLLNDREEDA